MLGAERELRAVEHGWIWLRHDNHVFVSEGKKRPGIEEDFQGSSLYRYR